MAHPLDIFQRIFVINLPSRPDRRREMADQLERIGQSIDSSQVEVFPAIRPDGPAGFPSIGARGCFSSHLAVLRRASEQRLERILILEDDLNFSPDFISHARSIAGRLRERDWSMFYGGYRLDRPVPHRGSGYVEIAAADGVQTSHFVGFQGAAIGKLVAYLEAQLMRPPGDALGGPMHVDGSYTWFRRAHPELTTLLAVPELGHQRASRTDVHKLGLRDSLPGVRAAMGIFRRLKNRLRKGS